jgi:hypothetical protein
VRADEIIDHLEGQVCARQWLVRKIHTLLKRELKNRSCGQNILDESGPRRESVYGLVAGPGKTTCSTEPLCTSPIRENRPSYLPLRLISNSKRSNFESRTERVEYRSPERNEPFGE